MPNTTSAPTRSSACTRACAPVTRTLPGPGLATCARGASAAGAPLGAGTGAVADPGAGGSAACAWSGRTGGWCAERAARSRGLGPGVPAGPERPVVCSVIGKSPLAVVTRLAVSMNWRWHKKSPRARWQSRGARSELLGQLPARRPSTRICGYFTGNTLQPSRVASTTDATCLTFRDGWLPSLVIAVVVRPGEHGLYARSGHRPGDQESLAELAAHFAQRDQLPWLLDALGDDLEPQVPAELDHGPGQQRERGVVTEPGDERGIDLDDVQRELAQVGQRGVAGAEVVDGQLHAHLVQGGQLLDDQLVLFDQDPLVDLDGERLGRQPGLGQDRGQPRPEGRRGELPGGQVHGDPDVPGRPAGRVAPGGALRARLPEHPLAERDDEAGLLGGAEELRRQDRLLVVPPADQRLGAGHARGGQVHDRLELERELVLRSEER